MFEMICDVWFLFVVFFFKQKTAYEMRISDRSSDVCSSDLRHRAVVGPGGAGAPGSRRVPAWLHGAEGGGEHPLRRGRGPRGDHHEIGRASCRERVCQYV